MNPFNRPPLNRLFHKEKPQTQTQEKITVTESKSDNGFSWKTVMLSAMLLAGIMKSADASPLTLSPEERRDAVEFMKSSKESVSEYEHKLLEMAKTINSVPDNHPESGSVVKKEFSVDSTLKVTIRYNPEGHPVSLSVSKFVENDKNGNSVTFFDGSHGQPMDAVVDYVTIDNGADPISYGFKHSLNTEGEDVVILTGIKTTSEGQASVALYRAQQGLENGLKEATESINNSTIITH